jgi:hypothetical protein
MADTLEATVHSWIRELNTGESFLSGTPSAIIQKQTTLEDRIVMEFNQSGLAPVEHAYLNFYIVNGDRTNNLLPSGRSNTLGLGGVNAKELTTTYRLPPTEVIPPDALAQLTGATQIQNQRFFQPPSALQLFQQQQDIPAQVDAAAA